MIKLLGMQVSHSSSNVSCKGESKTPVEWNIVILKNIVQTAFGAILSDDSQPHWVFHSCSNKLAEIRVIQHPERIISIVNLFLHY